MEFLDRCIADLAGSPEQSQRLAAAGSPCSGGPAQGASADAWAGWWKANRDYLFYGEIGGYRWYLDPLANSAESRPPSFAAKPAPAVEIEVIKQVGILKNFV